MLSNKYDTSFTMDCLQIKKKTKNPLEHENFKQKKYQKKSWLKSILLARHENNIIQSMLIW